MKVGDKVNVKGGKESDPAHAGAVGVVKDTKAPTVAQFGVEFEGAESLAWYVEDDLSTAAAPVKAAPAAHAGHAAKKD